MQALLGSLIYLPLLGNAGKNFYFYLDDRPKEVCQVGFGGVCYGLLKQHVLCFRIISHIVQLCETSKSLLRLFINLKGVGNSLAAVDGQFVNAGLRSSCRVCPMGSQQQMGIVHGVLAQHHYSGEVKPNSECEAIVMTLHQTG